MKGETHTPHTRHKAHKTKEFGHWLQSSRRHICNKKNSKPSGLALAKKKTQLGLMHGENNPVLGNEKVQSRGGVLTGEYPKQIAS